VFSLLTRIGNEGGGCLDQQRAGGIECVAAEQVCQRGADARRCGAVTAAQQKGAHQHQHIAEVYITAHRRGNLNTERAYAHHGCEHCRDNPFESGTAFHFNQPPVTINYNMKACQSKDGMGNFGLRRKAVRMDGLGLEEAES